MLFNPISIILGFSLFALPGVFAHPATVVIGEEAEPHLRGRRSFYRRDGAEHTVFEHDATKSKIDFVTNSGVCETTKGVNQYSGYVTVGSELPLDFWGDHNQSMWFWFFEARNKPKNAPLTLWINGGPGSSSMFGLFRENGPCQFVGDSPAPTRNPYSWNEYSNMLYVDQPISVGFSYGTNDVSSSVEAAPAVWTLLQAFFANFPRYEGRDFGLFTESYGGHFGPAFSDYFNSQNEAIKKKKVKGEKIKLIALGINNGFYDGISAFINSPSFFVNNSYRPLMTESLAQAEIQAMKTRCAPEVKKCDTLVGKEAICNNAQAVCEGIDGNEFYPIYSQSNFALYDIRIPAPGPFRSQTAYIDYLNDPAIKRKIGAKSNYVQDSDETYGLFYANGDAARSFIPTLSSLVSSGLPVLIWNGDADALCDWFTNYAVTTQISYPDAAKYKNTKVAPYKTRGVVKGEFKSVGKLSWLRVFEAGHPMPYDQPELALQAFSQFMEKGKLWST
ncbi:hypothetical protein HYFRA_00011180 [Hymenoscyphus fraxineus]|uniref:Carboxypeptidase n=1 Tax=Hymenoscyphus fraxineus TaxID=746836 RepID=A0A9N9L194_9HELO|nr:hypothetical protein HYFRA_00011180 [Hymenoscyphus fraxineus]